MSLPIFFFCTLPKLFVCHTTPRNVLPHYHVYGSKSERERERERERESESEKGGWSCSIRPHTLQAVATPAEGYLGVATALLRLSSKRRSASPSSAPPWPFLRGAESLHRPLGSLGWPTRCVIVRGHLFDGVEVQENKSGRRQNQVQTGKMV